MNDINWGDLVSSGINAYGNYRSGNQYNDAAQNAAGMADPFGPYRGQYAQKLGSLTSQPQNYFSGPWNQQLNALQTNPSSVSSLPGYQFGMDQGINAIQRSQASKGLLNSGATGKALTMFGQGYAGQQFNNERGFLANQANFESGLNANQYNQDRNFYGQAAGANFNPSTAAALAMAGKSGQLGAYGQGLGSLLSGGQYAGGNPALQSAISALTRGSSSSPLSQGINGLIKMFGSQNTAGTPDAIGGLNGSNDMLMDWNKYDSDTLNAFDSINGDAATSAGGEVFGGLNGPSSDVPIDWSSFGAGSDGAATSSAISAAPEAGNAASAASEASAPAASSALGPLGLFAALGSFAYGNWHEPEMTPTQTVQGVLEKGGTSALSQDLTNGINAFGPNNYNAIYNNNFMDGGGSLFFAPKYQDTVRQILGSSVYDPLLSQFNDAQARYNQWAQTQLAHYDQGGA